MKTPKREIRKWYKIRARRSPEDWAKHIESRIEGRATRAGVACLVLYDYGERKGLRDALRKMMDDYEGTEPATADQLRSGLLAVGYPATIVERRIYEGDR